MTDNKKVVLIGWNPEVLDTNNKPDNAPKNIMGALQAEQEKLHNLGYKASLLFINSADTAYNTVKNDLTATNYDCILIGAGVRTIPSSFLVFETLVNTVHEFAPKAKICFNTSPYDTTIAVQRWI
jgi:hypothetical protein